METLRFLMVSTFYPPYHLGGDAVHVQYLAEALAAAGHEVHVEFSPAAYRAKRGAGRPMVTDGDPRVQVHPMTSPSQVTSPIAAYLLGESHAVRRSHHRIVHDVNPDVVHLHNVSLLGLGVQEDAGERPVLYTAHDYWFRCPRSDLLKRGRSPCDSPSCLSCMIGSRRMPPPWRATDIAPRMNRVQCIIAPSQFIARMAMPSFTSPVVYIPNFAPDPNPDAEVGPPSPYFLYAGVLERHKGLRELVEAARRYDGPNQVLIVGSGSDESLLREFASRPGSHVSVQPWMNRPALDRLYRASAAFVMPSTCLENAPLAAVEALSWGTPLLATTRGGVPELLHGGAAGLAFNPEPASLLRAFQEFDELADPMKLRKSAREAYAKYHTPAVYLGRYLEVVRALLSGNTGTRFRASDEGHSRQAAVVPWR